MGIFFSTLRFSYSVSELDHDSRQFVEGIGSDNFVRVFDKICHWYDTTQKYPGFKLLSLLCQCIFCCRDYTFVILSNCWENVDLILK